MADCQCTELFAPVGKKLIGTNYQAIEPQLGQSCESVIETAFGTRLKDLEFEPERTRSCLRVCYDRFGKSAIGWIVQKAH